MNYQSVVLFSILDHVFWDPLPYDSILFYWKISNIIQCNSRFQFLIFMITSSNISLRKCWHVLHVLCSIDSPDPKMVSTVLFFKNQRVFFRLKIDKIYPVPECQATFAVSISNLRFFFWETNSGKLVVIYSLILLT